MTRRAFTSMTMVVIASRTAFEISGDGGRGLKVGLSHTMLSFYWLRPKKVLEEAPITVGLLRYLHLIRAS